MRSRSVWRWVGVSLSVSGLTLIAGAARAADPEPGNVGGDILNTGSSFRVHMGFRTPILMAADGKIEPLPAGRDKKPMPSYESSRPPADWKTPEFSDLCWARASAPVRSALGMDWASVLQNHRLCARGKFVVNDLAQVKGLKLAVDYRGGVVVYLNGVEVKRAHLPAGEINDDTVAENYPDEAYAENGALRPESDKRLRRMEVDLDSTTLRKGVNVLAVDVIRAPLTASAFSLKAPKDAGGRAKADTFFWLHMRLEGLRLTAAKGAAVVANVERPKGPQVWPVMPLETVMAWNYGDPAEKASIELEGVRNAAFSGRFVISSDSSLKNVKVTAGALAGEGGASLPASAIRIRYAMPATEDSGWVANMSRNGKYRYDTLEDAVPAEIPVPAADPSAGVTAGRLGALVPVWVTVNVPADAKPGLYRGEVVAGADGLAPVSISVTFKVHAWTLPEPEGYVGVNDFVASHESVALAYKEPLWTDRHFELMGKSLELGERLASRFCYANVLRGGHCMGNSESMIRWIPKADGTYEYDFGPFDKYLDLFAKKVGKPSGLVVTVWVNPTYGKRTTVSRFDPATKTLSSMEAPFYESPEAVAFWKPVMDQVRKRVEARGWWDVTLIGHTGDRLPTPKEVDCFKAIWPDGKWIFSAHMSSPAVQASDKSLMPIVVGERVWGVGRLYNPEVFDPIYGTTYPWRWKTTPDKIELNFPRYGQGAMHLLGDDGRLALWRMTSEAAIQGNSHGIGRVGLDFWPIPGRRHTHMDSLAGSSNQGMGHGTLAIVGVGKNGPVATERYEMCREGVQIREAIIFVQKALVAKKADPALLKRGKDLLDERARNYLRTMIEQNTAPAWLSFESTGWQDRDNRLFALCAELAGNGGGK